MLCLWLLSSAVVFVRGASNSLFAGARGITELKSVADAKSSDDLWLVNFYAPWCGHCREFANTWKKVGLQVASVEGVHLGAVSCPAHKDVCASENIKSYPTLKAFGKKEKVIKARSAKELVDFVTKKVPIAKISDAPEEEEWTEVSMRLETPVLADAEASLRYALDSSVFGNNNRSLSQSRLVALRGVLAALSVALPKIDVSEQLLAELSRHPSRTRWDTELRLGDGWTPSCDPERRGIESGAYTCGLWTLFHSLVAQSGAQPKLAPAAASAAIRAFVDNFFECKYCRNHFLKMYDDCEYGRCDDPSRLFRGATEGDRLALWLWRAHNAVNARVKGRASFHEDPNAPWAFPPRKLCRPCSRKGRWVEAEVLKFLRRTYGVDDGESDASKKASGSASSAKKSSSSFLTYFFVGALAAVFLYYLCGRDRHRSLFTTTKKQRGSDQSFV